MSGGFRLLALVFAIGFSTTKAYAILNTTQDGNAVNVSSLQPAAQNCDQTCDMVVDKATQQLTGLSGQDGWGMTDDQWCANHQAQTNPGVLPNPSPSPAPSGTPACNVPLLAGDTSCTQVNQMLTHCKLHGSQLEAQCLAYVQTKGVSGGENIIMGFDVAATATCVSACIMQAWPGGQAMIAACNIAGTAASAAEIIQTLASSQSASGKMISGMVGGIGLAKSVMSIHMDGLKGQKVGAPGSASQKKAGKQACISAAVFGAMTGIRAYSIHQQGKTKQNACDAVKQLATSAFAPGFAVTNPGYGSTSSTSGSSSSTTTGTTTGPPVQTNANGLTTGSAVRTNVAMLGDGSCDPTNNPLCFNCKSGATCAHALSNAVGTNSQAATDGGLLTSSGLAQALAPQVAGLPLDQMQKHIENGGTADQLIQSALRGGGGDFGNAVAALAKQAQQDAPNLGVSGTLASTPMGGGSMPGGQARGEEGDNAFKLMGQNDGSLGGQNSADFTKGPALNGAEIGSDGDIWHSHFSGSIFEIVSHKISKTRDRVDDVDYALPMNRALAGHR
jgi:hypothetical protein